MYKNLWIPLIFLLVVGILSVPVNAYLSPNTLDLNPNFVSSCPDRTLTKEDVNVTITNMGSSTDTYTVFMELPEGWSGFPTEEFERLEITLASFESTSVETFWITIPYNAEPGEYEIPIIVRSGLTTEELQKTLRIEVLNCHVVVLEISDTSKETCEEGGPVYYSFNVTNNGKFTETFDLRASVSGLITPEIGFSDNPVMLDPGEVKSLSVSVLYPRGVIGSQEIAITVESRDSFARDTKTLGLDIFNCYNVDMNIEPLEGSVCSGENSEHTIRVTNTGTQDDSYTLEALDWITLQEEQINLTAGESVDVIMVAVPEDVGRNAFEITLKSSQDPDLVITKEGIVNTMDCKGVAVILTPNTLNACMGDIVNFLVTVKNTGTMRDSFELSSNLGILEKENITLEPGEMETLNLEVNTSGLSLGIQGVTIQASNDMVSDSAVANILVEECYSASLDIQPQTLTSCPSAENPFTVSVINTGKIGDNYTITFNNQVRNMEIGPGETGSLEFYISYDTPGLRNIIVSVESEQVSLTKTLILDVRGNGECYSVEISLNNGLSNMEVSMGVAVPIIVKNTGLSRDVYNLTLEAPNWVYLEPMGFSLDPHEEGIVFLYLSPHFNTTEGTYDIKIDLQSPYIHKRLDLEAGVGMNATGNITISTVDGLTLNISIGGGIGGLVIADAPEWKTTVLLIITLIIIVILIVRFALLFK